MHFKSLIISSVLLAATASANTFVKRDSWGPSVGLGPAKYTILTTETTLYPGAMPADQKGLLWVWLGISNGTGDLIQSIVGSTPPGQSECGAAAHADETWCITSEVYGNTAQGVPNQWVGDLRTVDTDYANGITFNYTLVDRGSWTWNQTMRDAKTGKLLATYAKSSGSMLGWGTALECNDGCTGTVNPQYYRNSKIVLEAADPNFSSTIGASQGATHSNMVTTDGGKTWTIDTISIPAMNPGGASASTAEVAAASATTGVAPDTVTSVTALETVAATSLDSSPETATTDPGTTTAATPLIPVTTFSTVPSAANTTFLRPTGVQGGANSTHRPPHHSHHGHHNSTAATAATKQQRPPTPVIPPGAQGRNTTLHHHPHHHGHNGTATTVLPIGAVVHGKNSTRQPHGRPQRGQQRGGFS